MEYDEIKEDFFAEGVKIYMNKLFELDNNIILNEKYITYINISASMTL